MTEQKLFYEAIEKGDAGAVALLLLDPRVNPNTNKSASELAFAANNGYLEVVALLLNDGRINPAYFNNMAITYAALADHLDMVVLLLQDPRVRAAPLPTPNIKARKRTLEHALAEVIEWNVHAPKQLDKMFQKLRTKIRAEYNLISSIMAYNPRSIKRRR